VKQNKKSQNRKISPDLLKKFKGYQEVCIEAGLENLQAAADKAKSEEAKATKAN